MALLKLLFVLLIMVPIAIIMMFIIDNLSKEAKQAKSGPIDMDEVREKKRRSKKPPKKKEPKNKEPKAKEPKKKEKRKKESRKQSSRRSVEQQRPAARRPAPRPIEPPISDHSQDYINEYNRKKAEIESNSRRSGKRNTAEEFDMLYGSGTTEKKSSRTSGKKSSGKTSRRSSNRSGSRKRKK